ncbi:ankyrin repeat domain-containing protein [Candidatus Dependentiae bacterium]|nr:ankyrin repeat domain-containing protein [Candidatus Dependentiae bacterium]MBU4387404.1 ankyrin repeat domain-containing protein [Candidatus Dependentiae bacterium]MCG2756777.1 ankyrin repeat domain-containing protein [Candidatus Dependentiae bacterium]
MNKKIFKIFLSFSLIFNIFANNGTAQLLSEEKNNLPSQILSPSELNTLDEDGYSPLHNVIIDEELSLAPTYIQAIKNAVYCWTEAKGESFCGKAYHKGDNIDPIMVTWSADQYGKEDALNAFLAIFEECKITQIEQVKSLIKSGANVNLPDSEGRTALWWAAERNLPEIISVLIELGANVDGYGTNIPLHIAALDGNKEAVECLLSNCANANLIDEDGNSALHLAGLGETWLYPSKSEDYKGCNPDKLQDYINIIQRLIRHGAKKDLKNKMGFTPLQMAINQQKEFYPELTEITLAKYIEDDLFVK